MRVGKYNYQDFFVNRYVEQLVIPEIQRDYVWQETHVNGLLKSIADDFERFLNADIPSLNSDEGSLDQQLYNDFANFYRQRNCSSNIGFIYAYSDQQYDGRYFLIDGQQRITTLYLLLLLLAVRTNNGDDFEKKYCSKDIPKLDYRVRDSARSFIRQLVSFVLLSKSHKDIKEQHWCLNSYENDITVTNIINNLDVINKFINTIEESKRAKFYDYINNFTEFWYFDTNISAQGENLYIYLNARGKPTEENENLKAKLLGPLKLESDPLEKNKNDWGKEWEDWQDFFWRMRGKGIESPNLLELNADKGFNEFLNCIAGLEIYLLNENKEKNQEDKDKDKEKNLIKVISGGSTIEGNALSKKQSLELLEVISRYIEVLKYIEGKREELSDVDSDESDKNGSGKNESGKNESDKNESGKNESDKNESGKNESGKNWFKKCLFEFWKILNAESTAWDNYEHDNLSKKQCESTRWCRMVFVWGVLHWVDSAHKKLSKYRVLRGIRQFYLRYQNKVRSVVGDSGIKESVKNLCGEKGYILIKPEYEEYEEYKKERWLEEVSKKEVSEKEKWSDLEVMLWRIEDHPLNINGCISGSDDAPTNSSHLIPHKKYEGLTLEKLTKIKDIFYKCFDPKEGGSNLDEKDFPVVQSLLLHYGQFWVDLRTRGYYNYRFSDWRKVVRSLKPHSNFNVFFDELMEEDCSVEELLEKLLEKKREDFEKELTKEKLKGKCTIETERSLQFRFRWYNHYLKEDMWRHGAFICEREEEKDEVFVNHKRLLNTQGNLRGKENQSKLYTLLLENIKEDIKRDSDA